MSNKTNTWNKYKLFFGIGIWTSLIVAAFILLSIYLIGTLQIPFINNIIQPANEDVFDSVVELTEKKVSRYLGEWEFEEPKIPGHFHHIGRWYQSDDLSFCIECHGPIPHSKIPKQRAFLNMHSFFISCKTCHVQEKEGVLPSRFRWAGIEDGLLGPNPIMAKGVWGEYGAKIVSVKGPMDDLQPVDLEQEAAFAKKFRKERERLNENQKVIGNKFIHRRNVETPVGCSDCHNSQEAFLPYAELGYSVERAGFLMSAEVVDLAEHYETFYLPNLLNTGRIPNGTGESSK